MNALINLDVLREYEEMSMKVDRKEGGDCAN
jgi:hypothetical protein